MFIYRPNQGQTCGPGLKCHMNYFVLEFKSFAAYFAKSARPKVRSRVNLCVFMFHKIQCLYFVQISLAVAKALRRVAEGKASAQAEAAEWKRKYELERARNLHLEHKGFLND